VESLIKRATKIDFSRVAGRDGPIHDGTGGQRKQGDKKAQWSSTPLLLFFVQGVVVLIGLGLGHQHGFSIHDGHPASTPEPAGVRHGMPLHAGMSHQPQHPLGIEPLSRLAIRRSTGRRCRLPLGHPISNDARQGVLARFICVYYLTQPGPQCHHGAKQPFAITHLFRLQCLFLTSSQRREATGCPILSKKQRLPDSDGIDNGTRP